MKKIFKILLFSTALISSMILLGMFSTKMTFPEIKSSEVIYRMKGALNKIISAEIAFDYETISSEGDTAASGAGIFSVQGDAYKISIENFSIYCNGSSKWIYDIDNKEITIFPFTAENAEFLENPFVILKNMNPEDFKIPVRAKMNEAMDELCYELIIGSKDKKSAYSKIIIYVNANTFLPVAIDYKNRNGDKYVLDIVSIVGVDERNLSFFAPDREILEDPDVYITDMR